MDIDFVITWVDGSDPAWREEKEKYQPKTDCDNREERYRDWELLPYWFRGVERFAPWVRKIHFITWGHLPAWLDTSNPKLHIVNHRDYIPEEYLPTFCSDTIELFMNRIEGLAEHFVYFNDDMFCIAPLEEDVFFHNGLPRDMLAFQPIVANTGSPPMPYLFLNNTMLLARHFKKRENVKKQPGAYFKLGYPPLYFLYNILECAFPLYTGFYTPHCASPFLKETFRQVWEAEGDCLSQALLGKFRDREHITQYVFREWQKLSGQFVPTNVHRYFQYFNVESHNEKIVDTICHQKRKMICINDANTQIDFDRAKQELIQAFQTILPHKSSFEKE